MKKIILKRIMAFLLCFALLFGSFPELRAADNLVQNLPENNTEPEKYPLIEAFLNQQLKIAEENANDIYVLEFETGKKSEILKQLEKVEGLTIRYDYDTIFEGVSVLVPNRKLEEIRNISGIKNIQKNGSFVPQAMNASELTKVAEAAQYNNTVLFPQEEGKKFDGRGTIIAIIDSGININHPAMQIDEEAKPYVKIKESEIKEGFSLKVPRGFNYLGGSYDLLERLPSIHGLHVAGIAAGNDPAGFKGVAPNAQIFMYRVFSDRRYKKPEYNLEIDNYEFGGDDAVYHAMEDAVENGADVISMSIGRPGGGYIGDIYYNAVKNATEKGVAVVAAIGNYSSSASSNTYDNSPNNALNLTDTSAMTYIAGVNQTLSVGSTVNTKISLGKLKINDREFGYAFLGTSEKNKPLFKAGEYELVYVGHGRKSAFNNKDLNGKIALAFRDGNKIVDKIKEAAEKGAKGFILINAPTHYSRDRYRNQPSISYEVDREMTAVVEDQNIWAISISGNDGKILKEMMGQNAKMNFDFPNEKISHHLAEEIRMSGFSGWGPNAELELKPEVVAPGEAVYSCFNHGKYGFMSGTSMSTPHVAGISALLREKVKDLTDKKEIAKNLGKSAINKILLMNTAQPLKELLPEISELEVSPRRQGAGFVQVDAALKNNVIVTHNNIASVALKEIKGNTTSFELRLDNFSDKQQAFRLQFGKVLGETQIAVEKDDTYTGREEGELEDYVKTAQVNETHSREIGNAKIFGDKSEVEIPAGQSATVKVTLNTGNSQNEFVEGFIYFVSKNKEDNPDLSIPYFGYKGDWDSGKIIDSPSWEKDSLTKLTTVMATKPVGHDEEPQYFELGKENGVIDPSKIAFTNDPLNTFLMREVIARVITLREAKDFEVSILNEQKQHIRTLSTSHYYRKLINNLQYENSWHNKEKIQKPNLLFSWNGQIYDKKSGELKAAPEGQYYYRVRAKVRTDAPYQEILMPVRIDNQKPQGIVKIEGLNVVPKSVVPVEAQAKSQTASPVAIQAATNASIQISPQKVSARLHLTDNHGIWFVGASLDNKPLNVKKISNTEYVVEDIKVNGLTKSKLRIEAMDYAGNPMKPYEEELNKSGVYHSETGQTFGPKKYIELEDEEERNWRNRLGKLIAPWTELTPSSPLLEEENGRYYFKVDCLDIPEESDNYKLKITSVNTFRGGYDRMTDMDLTPAQACNDLKIEVKNGFNVVNITVYKEEDKHIVFSRGYAVVLDTEPPVISENSSSIEYEKEEDDENEKGIFYTNSDIVEINGKIKDNNDHWRLFVNENNVESHQQDGEFDQPEREFSAKVKVSDGDKLTLKAVDRLGNERIKRFTVVLDTVAPTIEVTPKEESGYMASTVLKVEFKDDKVLRGDASKVFVNGNLYQEGTPLSQYGENKFFIYMIAMDKAGNKTQKEIFVNLEDQDKEFAVRLKKDSFYKAELKNIEALFELPEGMSVALVEEVDTSAFVATMKVEFKNKYGMTKTMEYSVKLLDSDFEKYKPVLKKTHFLAEELTDEGALFDIPVGVAVTIERIDASVAGEKSIKASFYYGNKQAKAEYKITVVPELTAKLRKTSFMPSELRDIAQVVELTEGLKAIYKEEPNFAKYGEQKITIIVMDHYGHKKEISFDIILKEEMTLTAYEPSVSTPVTEGSTPVVKKDKTTTDISKEKMLKKETAEDVKLISLNDIKGHWAQEIIQAAVKDNLIKGYPDGSFRPDNSLSRAEFVALLNRVLQLKATEGSLNFKDISRENWYYSDLAALTENGLINGHSKDEFAPQKAITRSEIIVILLRYLHQVKAEMLHRYQEKEFAFEDKAEINEWALQSLKEAYNLGLVIGVDNRIMPNKEASRAEMIKMLYQLKQMMN